MSPFNKSLMMIYRNTRMVLDALVEAFAEWAHREVRTRLWGYAPEEALSVADLVRERYDWAKGGPAFVAALTEVAAARSPRL